MSKTIGKYQIQGEIGKGGFGTVYRAWDPTVNRSVAIKVLTTAGDDDLLTRFRNEAASTGNLHHRNIVTIHDFGEQDGVPYMVMQLLEGQTLQEVQAKSVPLTLVQKMHIMGQVADGLHYAHQHGVIHRDVKPANVMIMPDQSVQIMDFGIARVTASTSRQTRTGFVIGTVLYMAPEQFLPGKSVDHRTDIWAYGVMYYEFLTGKHPFSGPDEMSTLYQVAHVEPNPLRSLAPDVPASLEEVIHRLLAKDPDLRYSSLRDVNFDVQPILLELKRGQAAEMVAKARELASEERYDDAQKAAHEILELDPSNREANLLLQSVKQRLQRKVVQPKIQSLVEKAEHDVQARSWQPAIDALQSALRLNPADTAIQARLDQIRAQADASKKAEMLVLDAQRELKARNFTAAFKIATEATKADPASPSASHVLSQIQREMEARANDKQRGDALAAARSMLLLGEHSKAIAHLQKLAAEIPGDDEIESLLESAQEQARKKELTADIEKAVAASDFGRAANLVNIARDEFPDDSAFARLGSRVQTARNAFELDLAQSRIRDEIDAGQLGIASEFLKVALKRFPTDAALLAMNEELRRKRQPTPPVVPMVPVSAATATARAPERAPVIPDRPLPRPEPVIVPRPEPAPVPAAAVPRSRMPLILGSAAVVLLAIIGGVVALKPGATPEQTPSTSTPAPAAVAPTERPAPVEQQPAVHAPGPESPAQIAPAPAPPVSQPPAAAAKQTKARQREQEVEEEPAPVPPPPAPSASPGVKVGATAVTAGRVIQVPPRSGLPAGRVTWTGELAPGGRIVLSRTGVVDGPGVMTGADGMPPFSEVDITSISPYGNLVLTPSGANLAIGNGGQVPISRIEITWKVKQQ